VFRLVRVVRITIRDVKVPEWSLGQNTGLRHNLGNKGNLIYYWRRNLGLSFDGLASVTISVSRV